MVKRVKRLEKGIESLKEEIEKHFEKLRKDIEEENIDLGRYHARELDKSLISSLELKLKILGVDDNSAKKYRERLNKMKEEFGL